MEVCINTANGKPRLEDRRNTVSLRLMWAEDYKMQINMNSNYACLDLNLTVTMNSYFIRRHYLLTKCVTNIFLSMQF